MPFAWRPAPGQVALIEVVGLEDSFDGLIEPNRSRVMTAKDVTGILRRGGTILGTVNRGDPFAYPVETSEGKHDYSTRVVEMFHRMGLDALVVIGGDGTLAIAHKFSRMGIPLVGVGLMYREGYFRQYLNVDGWQQERYPENDFFNLPLIPETRPDGTPLLVSVPFPGREVWARVWRIHVGRVPLYLLDTNIAKNSAEDRQITSRLYGGDNDTRIRQEMVLGIGGFRALRLLGKEPTVCHMNEGHSAFCGLERIRNRRTHARRRSDRVRVRARRRATPIRSGCATRGRRVASRRAADGVPRGGHRCGARDGGDAEAPELFERQPGQTPNVGHRVAGDRRRAGVGHVLLLQPQPARQPADHRVEPAHAHRQLGREPGEEVAPPDVRHLVGEDQPQLFGRPVPPPPRQQDHRPE